MRRNSKIWAFWPRNNIRKCISMMFWPPSGTLGHFFFFFWPIFFFFWLKCALRVVWWAPEAVTMLARMHWTPSCPIPSTCAAGWRPQDSANPSFVLEFAPAGIQRFWQFWGGEKQQTRCGNAQLSWKFSKKLVPRKGFARHQRICPRFSPRVPTKFFRSA